jgi:hypothetical protein
MISKNCFCENLYNKIVVGKKQLGLEPLEDEILIRFGHSFWNKFLCTLQYNQFQSGLGKNWKQSFMQARIERRKRGVGWPQDYNLRKIKI